jgi:hypothetical protein
MFDLNFELSRGEREMTFPLIRKLIMILIIMTDSSMITAKGPIIPCTVNKLVCRGLPPLALAGWGPKGSRC